MADPTPKAPTAHDHAADAHATAGESVAGAHDAAAAAADHGHAEAEAFKGAVDDHGHAADAHAHDAHAADAHAVAGHGKDAHGHDAHGSDHHGRHVTHPPEPPHLIQLWFQSDYKALKKEGKNPYGDVGEGHDPLTTKQILHVGRLEKPIPLIGYAPWENHVYFGLACVVLVVLALVLTAGFRRERRTAMRRPTRLQVLTEMIVDGFDNFVKGVLGDKHGRFYLPYIGSLFFLVLVMNLMGLIPTLRAPSASIVITASLALCTLLVVQFTAWVKLGPLHYLWHLAGSPQTPVQWALSPLFLLLEAMSDFVIKPLSLSLRLMGNILGKDILLGSFLFMGISLAGLLAAGSEKFVGLPLGLPFYFLGLLLSTIQALIFALLSAIYVLLVLPHDHDHEHDEHHEHDHAHPLPGEREVHHHSAEELKKLPAH